MKTKTLTLIFLFVYVSAAIAGTKYYRLSYRDDPSTTIVVGWCDDGTSTNARIYYGTTDNGTNYQSYPFDQAPDRTESSFKGLNHRFARLSGLTPNTFYYFVIRDDQGTSQRMIFKTIPDDPDIPITFISGGDSRTGTFLVDSDYNLCRPRRQEANKLVSKIRPSFVSFSGDFVFSIPDVFIASTNADWADWFEDWQMTISSDGQLYPMVPTFGNHEETDDVYNVFDIPTNNSYYSLGVGGNLLRIYTLNTELNCDSAQRNWLENDLQLHTGNANEPYWKFAQMHYPFVPHANYDPNTVMIDCWASLLQDYKVRVVSEAHAHIMKVTWPIVTSSATGSDHGFIRNDSTGIVYIGEGSWGAPLRDLYTYYSSSAAFNWTRNQEKMPGFHLICVSKEKMEIRTIKIENSNYVAENGPNEPSCKLPANIVVWNPSNGSVVTLTNPSDTTVLGEREHLPKEMAVVSPNPSAGVLNLNFFEPASDIGVVVYNALGRQIKKAEGIRGRQLTVDLSDEAEGVYFIYITKGKKVESHKVSLVR